MNTNATAKRILCYGDSYTWGWVPSGMGLERFPANQRWTGVLQELLGNGFEIIEEGLGARTTMFDDPRPDFAGRNGLKTLPAVLETHLPLNLVILMLGTADTKEMMGLPSVKIIEGMRRLVKTVKEYKTLKGGSVPKVLIVVPPIVREETAFASALFRNGSAKGKELAAGYKKLAESENVLCLDPTAEISADKTEGVHLDAANNRRLANLIYQIIKA